MSLLLATLSAAAFQSAAIDDCSFLVLTRTPSRSRTGPERIAVCRQRAPRGDEQHFNFFLTRTPHLVPPSTAQASSRDCPAARARLAEVERLALPVIEVITRERPIVVTADGVRYRLDVRWTPYGDTGHTGNLSLDSNVGTPLAAWSEALFAALEPCWSDRP